MPLTSTKSGQTTPLDYMAEGYWQDFLAKRPIAGGIAYESALQDCNLDVSMLSLQRVDMLLSQLRRDLIQADKWHEHTLLADIGYRNLLIFLAFYAGRVLSKQSQKTLHWYGLFELREHYPQLPIIGDDFYQHMALFVEKDGFDTVKEHCVVPVFFALEPIGMRLFGHIDRQFQTIFGGQVAGGLYQAVTEFLSCFSIKDQPNSIFKPPLIYTSNPTITPEPVEITVLLPPVSSEAAPFQSVPSEPILAQAALSRPQTVSPENSVTLVMQNAASEPMPLTVESLTVQASTVKKVVKPVIVTPAMFTQFLIELDDIEVIQNAGDNEYQQACKILDQFERHIAKQSKPRAQVLFSESHQRARHRAMQLLAEAATVGHTAAMARLGMYELLGEGLESDSTVSQIKGVDWLKQAASANDSRAQRLLSKLYYQGVGVSQDMEVGKYWLEQAATNGHPEAITVLEQWQQAETLITVQQKEQHSLKRYQLLLTVIMIVAILLIVLV